jgi:hypothetical protein
LLALHIGVVPLQSALPKHCTHAFISVLHRLVVPPHLVSSRHCTQVYVSGLHTDKFPFPAHPALSVHCTHAPVGAQAGWAAFFDLHSVAAKPLQLTHWFAEQRGVVPLHFVWSTHCTHRFVSVLHTFPSLQVELSLQSTHDPALAPDSTHAGAAAFFLLH